MSDLDKLPQDMFEEILSRVPVKSLCTSRCVAKSWRTLISAPHFIARHLNLNKPRERVIFSTSVYSFGFNDKSIDDNGGVVLEPEVKHPDWWWVRAVGSCNGLLLVVDREEAMFLVNPSTQQSQKLSVSPLLVVDREDPCSTSVVYGLGYDSVTDDYKVVTFSSYDLAHDHNENQRSTSNFVDVYSNRTREWRRIGRSLYDYPASVPWQGVFVNDRIHWLANRNRDHSLVIAAFGLGNEEFTDLPTPVALANYGMVLFHDLLILGGYVCIAACCRNFQTEIIYDLGK